jgi:hypothetical protein
MRLTRLFGVIMILATGSPVGADIYVWTDAAGVNHYTNDLANVPSDFRGEAMTVARDWVRAAPPEEPQPPAASSDPTPSAAGGDVYEAAYQAGFRAGTQAAPAPASPFASNAGSVVQSVWIESLPPQVTERWVTVPVLVERRPFPRRVRGHVGAIRRRLPPAVRAPFLLLPAGPPPISER